MQINSTFSHFRARTGRVPLALGMILACASAVQAQQASSADPGIIGPYVVNPVLNNRVSAAATVQWLKLGPQVTVSTPGDDQSSRVLQVEGLTFSHLKPGALYNYHAGPAGDGHFKAPPVKEEPFSFLLYADTRNGNVSNTIAQTDTTNGDIAHAHLVERMVSEHPDFVLHAGDIIQNGEDQDEWANFFRIEHELLRSTSFFFVFGNHEWNSPFVHTLFNQPQSYYSYNWGTSHFVVLNTETDKLRPFREGETSETEQRDFWVKQMQWLKEDLNAHREAKHIFVCMHLSPWTATAYKLRDRHFVERTELVPILEQYKQIIVLAGHDHNYQHHLLHGIHYFASGGGGASLERVDWPLPGITVKALAKYNYVRVHVNGDEVTIDAVSPDGEVLEHTEIKKTN